MKSLQKLWIGILLEDNQKFFIRNLKNDYLKVKTDVFGKIFYTNRTVLYVLNLKEETIEVFINKVFYTKQLMSLKLLRYSWEMWCKQQMFYIQDKDYFIKAGETNTHIRNNTSIKYLLELKKIINTKNIFT